MHPGCIMSFATSKLFDVIFRSFEAEYELQLPETIWVKQDRFTKGAQVYSFIVLLIVFSLFLAVSESAQAGGLKCRVQTSSLKLCGAQTDNYKACYNAGQAPDARTWLPFYLVQAARATYVADTGQSQWARRIMVHKVAGRKASPKRGYLSVKALTGNVDFLQFRNGPPSTLFGVFFQLHDKTLLSQAMVKMTVTLRSSHGGLLGTTPLSYRYEPNFANVDPSHTEYNGPGGRWWVNGVKTRTNVELGAPGC